MTTIIIKHNRENGYCQLIEQWNGSSKNEVRTRISKSKFNEIRKSVTVNLEFLCESDGLIRKVKNVHDIGSTIEFDVTNETIKETPKPNAKLIASAPELLETLKEVLGAYGHKMLSKDKDWIKGVINKAE